MGAPFKIKIAYHQNELLLAANSEQEMGGVPSHYYLFGRLVQDKLVADGHKLKECSQEKMVGVPEGLVANANIYGKLSKKSQVLGKWEERFIVINKEGLLSYKKFSEKYSWSISRGSIKEIWTRFEVQDNLLIIKIHHSSKKTEFGIPLMELLSPRSWLLHFYSLMGRK